MTQRPASRRTLALVGAACLALAGSGLALAADQAVTMDNLSFAPSTVTINVGDLVRWRNNDNVSHTATADDGSFDTGTISSGQNDAVTFDTAGTFAYHCSIHPNMTGTVVVEAGAAPTASPAPTGAPGATQPPTDMASVSDPARTSTGGGLVLLLLAVMALAALWTSLLLERRRSR
jgi:plastocyanin